MSWKSQAIVFQRTESRHELRCWSFIVVCPQAHVLEFSGSKEHSEQSPAWQVFEQWWWPHASSFPHASPQLYVFLLPVSALHKTSRVVPWDEQHCCTILSHGSHSRGWQTWNERIANGDRRHWTRPTTAHAWCWHRFNFPHGISHLRIAFEWQITVPDSRPHRHDCLVMVLQFGQGPGWQSLIEKTLVKLCLLFREKVVTRSSYGYTRWTSYSIVCHIVPRMNEESLRVETWDSFVFGKSNCSSELLSANIDSRDNASLYRYRSLLLQPISEHSLNGTSCNRFHTTKLLVHS